MRILDDREVVLALGSNSGDRLKNLSLALNLLKESGLSITKKSSVWESPPMNMPEYSYMLFLNSVILTITEIEPLDILQSIKKIEVKLGRAIDHEKNTPRTIDIDIIFYGRKVINCPELIIPHPRWHERLFVVQPLYEILPNIELPGNQNSLKEILANLKKTQTIKLFSTLW